ncbi:MAG TPA: potassium channel family protein [Bacteroidota bacterium]|nr:potassium channel family protein [Bacteroidota bacterium]
MASHLAFRLRIYLSILIGVFLVGMVGLIIIEKFSPLDAFYFIVSTISTVGYGDLHPVTPAGKILVILIILTGVGCFVGVVANAIEYMIDERERVQRLEKLNMIIGVFFSEIGTTMLKRISVHDPNLKEIQSTLVVTNNWSEKDFANSIALLENHQGKIDSRTVQLDELRIFLGTHRAFLLALLENPQLIEHDSFIPLLQAIFHVTEELFARERLVDLPSSDYDHLSVDINRVYTLLIVEWMRYMRHLKENYPYLFSLAMRTNPFDANASAIVK